MTRPPESGPRSSEGPSRPRACGRRARARAVPARFRDPSARRPSLETGALVRQVRLDALGKAVLVHVRDGTTGQPDDRLRVRVTERGADGVVSASELRHWPPRARRSRQSTNAALSALLPCLAYHPLPTASSIAFAAWRASWPASSAATMSAPGRCFASLPGKYPFGLLTETFRDTSYSTILHLTTGEGDESRSERHGWERLPGC